MSRRGEGPAPIVRGCDVAPEGWRCTRASGHDGPCAAVPALDTEACPGPPQCILRDPHDAHLTAESLEALQNGPRLGLATTRELFEELNARMDFWPPNFWAARAVMRGAMGAIKDSGVAEKELSYRTVDSQ